MLSRYLCVFAMFLVLYLLSMRRISTLVLRRIVVIVPRLSALRLRNAPKHGRNTNTQ